MQDRGNLSYEMFINTLWNLDIIKIWAQLFKANDVVS